MNLWIKILEATASQLISLEGEVLASISSIEKERQLFYIQVLKNFYRQDVEGLQLLLSENAAWLKEHRDLQAIAQIRLHNRKGTEDLNLITDILNQANSESPLMRAELSFVAAAVFQLKKRFDLSEKYYREASALYEVSEAHKKSIRALLSSIAAYSCLKPESRLFGEYMNLYKKALACSDFLSAATALINISREFQILGSNDPALEYVSNAIGLLNDHALASREHGLALAHRAHLYLESKSFNHAHQDLTYALSIPHLEVQAACQVLAEKFQLNLKSLQSSQLLPGWKERLESKEAPKALTRLESKLISLIAEKSQTKYELMDELYGELLDFDTKEARFKNILARVRSARPGLIILVDHKYSIHEPTQNSLLNGKRDVI